MSELAIPSLTRHDRSETLATTKLSGKRIAMIQEPSCSHNCVVKCYRNCTIDCDCECKEHAAQVLNMGVIKELTGDYKTYGQTKKNNSSYSDIEAAIKHIKTLKESLSQSDLEVRAKYKEKKGENLCLEIVQVKEDAGSETIDKIHIGLLMQLTGNESIYQRKLVEDLTEEEITKQEDADHEARIAKALILNKIVRDLEDK